MTEQICKPTTKKDMKAAFPIQTLPKRETEPDIRWFIQTNQTLQACTRTQNSILGPLGLIFCATTPNVYAAMMTSLYPMIEAPGNLPDLCERQMDHQRERAKIQWRCHMREYQTSAR